MARLRQTAQQTKGSQLPSDWKPKSKQAPKKK